MEFVLSSHKEKQAAASNQKDSIKIEPMIPIMPLPINLPTIQPKRTYASTGNLPMTIPNKAGGGNNSNSTLLMPSKATSTAVITGSTNLTSRSQPISSQHATPQRNQSTPTSINNPSKALSRRFRDTQYNSNSYF